MKTMQDFLESIKAIWTKPIPESIKNQFRMACTNLQPDTPEFQSLVKRFLTDENLRTKRKWDNDCKIFYVWFLMKYFQNQKQECVNPTMDEWRTFQEILNFDQQILKQRWITLINPLSKTGNWSPTEDKLIIDQMNLKNNKHIWTQISILLYDQNSRDTVRTPKQIRERWFNYLNPALIKSQWEMNEDIIILQAILSIGKKWSQISSLLEGRTENQVKNRYKSLQSQIKNQGKSSEINSIKEYIQKYQPIQSKTQQIIKNQKQIDNTILLKCENSSDESYNQAQIKSNKQSISNRKMTLRSEIIYDNSYIQEIQIRKRRNLKKNIQSNVQLEQEVDIVNNPAQINIEVEQQNTQEYEKTDLIKEEHLSQEIVEVFSRPNEQKDSHLTTDSLLDLEGNNQISYSPCFYNFQNFQSEEIKDKFVEEFFSPTYFENSLPYFNQTLLAVSPMDNNQNGIACFQFNFDMKQHMNPYQNESLNFNFDNPIIAWNQKRNNSPLNNN